jgi:uncharacterized protein (TIGR02301 family)
LLAFAALPPATRRSALAQDRSPAERQTLLDLAFTLGESHALRQVCEGAGDQYWRARMMRLTEVEKADQAFDAQLRDRFNTGFAAGPGPVPRMRRGQPAGPSSSGPQGPGPGRQAGPSMRIRAPSDQAAPESVADN